MNLKMCAGPDWHLTSLDHLKSLRVFKKTLRSLQVALEKKNIHFVFCASWHVQ